MQKLAPFAEEDASGKAIIENNEIKLTQQVEVLVGFGHSIDEYNGRIYNRLRLYKMEVLTECATTVATPQPTPQPVAAPTPQPTQIAQSLIDSFANLTPADKLPF
jgi:hypothetical protein